MLYLTVVLIQVIVVEVIEVVIIIIVVVVKVTSFIEAVLPETRWQGSEGDGSILVEIMVNVLYSVFYSFRKDQSILHQACTFLLCRLT